MRYGRIVTGKFLNRPNRFIAYCEIDGSTERCHVKNTGRRVELLTAFGILNGRFPTKEEIVNECIRAYFNRCTSRTAAGRIPTT